MRRRAGWVSVWSRRAHGSLGVLRRGIAFLVLAVIGLTGCDPGTFDIKVFPPAPQDNCPAVSFTSYAVLTTPVDGETQCIIAECAQPGQNVHNCLDGGETSLINDDDSVRIRLVMLGPGSPPTVLLCGESNMSLDINDGDEISINLECDSSCQNQGCEFATCRQQMMMHCGAP